MSNKPASLALVNKNTLTKPNPWRILDFRSMTKPYKEFTRLKYIYLCASIHIKYSDDSAPMNHLLAALPADEFARLKPDLEPVSLSPGKVICESGEQLEYIYFPKSGGLGKGSLPVLRHY